jgi:mevalonate kinase
VPGKVFLLGEYAVLSGHPALVAAIPPRFRAGAVPVEYLPSSPAGRLLLAAGQERGLSTEDPHRGRGGFGASTAEFALVYRELASTMGWALSGEAVWRKYRELHAALPLLPSGADLFTQWSGGVVRFDPARVSESESLRPSSPVRLVVWSATGQPGRKVATHAHLRASRASSASKTRSAIRSSAGSMRFVPATPPRRAPRFRDTATRFANSALRLRKRRAIAKRCPGFPA